MERGSSLRILEGGLSKLSTDEEDDLIFPNISLSLSLSLSLIWLSEVWKREKGEGGSYYLRRGSVIKEERESYSTHFCFFFLLDWNWYTGMGQEVNSNSSPV